ncbi:interleukin 15, like [Centroberyx affinis]|uniref:interleukin 15, like n=1 Tax=Centroberyx affinis TaxID=166261 RepID=UPI003A5C0350
MLRGRPALMSVFLWFVYLPVQTSGAPACSREAVHIVSNLTQKAKETEWLTSRLYTPTMDDYNKCPISTLKCFAQEVKVLKVEWPSNGPTTTTTTNLLQLARHLGNLGRQINQTCNQMCELHEEKAAGEFLETLKVILQSMNVACGTDQ